jgi:hypothetical protein
MTGGERTSTASHITTLQQYVRTADLDHFDGTVEKTVAEPDVASLSYQAKNITHADWKFPGHGPTVLDFQAMLMVGRRFDRPDRLTPRILGREGDAHRDDPKTAARKGRQAGEQGESGSRAGAPGGPQRPGPRRAGSRPARGTRHDGVRRLGTARALLIQIVVHVPLSSHWTAWNWWGALRSETRRPQRPVGTS